MSALLGLIALALAPAAALYLREWLLLRSSGREPHAPDRPPGLTRHGESLQELVLDLRRLEAEFRRVERSDLPAKAHRLEAIGLAYDDVLTECCEVLGLPTPSRRPLSTWDRMQTQLELARHGLDW